MQKTILSKIIDLFFCFVATIILTILIVNSIFKAKTFSLIIGSILGSLIFLLEVKLLHIHSERKSIKGTEEALLKLTFESLSVLNPQAMQKLLINALSNNPIFCVKKVEDFILVTNTTSASTFAIGFDFLQEVVDSPTLFKFLNNTKIKNASKYIFLAKDYTKNASLLNSSQPTLILFDSEDTYNLFKLINLSVPSISTLKKRNRKEELKLVFSKINIRKFLLVSILLLIISFFTPLKIYYRIFSAISFLLFLICALLKPAKSKDKNSLSPENLLNL